MRHLNATLCVISIAASAALAPAAVQAQDKLIAFDVPAGALGTVLDEIARQARTRIAYDTVAVTGKSAPAINGSLSLAEALKRATAGTELETSLDGKGMFKVAPTAGVASDLPQQVVVTASRGTYAGVFATTLTRTDTPRRETPGTLDVVTSDALEARNATSFEDILKNIPGVTYQPTGAGAQAAQIRGDLSTNVQENGLGTTSNGTTPPIGNVDHVEVFKGPSALLTGTTAGAGTINFVSKTATLTPVKSLTLGAGMHGFTEVIGDVGGAVNDAKTIGVRLVAQSDQAVTDEYGFHHVYERLISPKLRYKTADTLFDLDYQHYEKRRGQTTFAYFTPDASNPARGSLTKYDNQLDRDAGTHDASDRTAVSLERTLIANDSLTLKLRPKLAWETGETDIRTGGGYIPPSEGSDPYYLLISNYVSRSQLSTYTDLYAKFATGPLEHQAIVAYDFTHGHSGAASDSAVFPFYNTFPQVAAGDTAVPAPVPRGSKLGDIVTVQRGIIVQDQITAGRWHALLAVRHSVYNNRGTGLISDDSVYSLPADQQVPTFDADPQYVTLHTFPTVHTSRNDPSGGLVFDLTESASIYASYTSSFYPQLPGQVGKSDGSALKPQVRKQAELGAKVGLFDERLQFTASLYKYRTDNNAQTDPANPRYAIDGPGREATGFELSAIGRIDRQTNVIAGFSRADVKQYYAPVTSFQTGAIVAPALQSADANGIPTTTANLFVTRDFTIGALSGFGVGLGGNYASGFKYLYRASATSQAIGDVSRPFVSIDASLRYSTGPTRFNLSITNLTNRFNVYPSTTLSQIGVGPGRNAKLTMQHDF